MEKSRNSWIGGLLLIAIGLIFLLNQFTQRVRILWEMSAIPSDCIARFKAWTT